MKLRQIGISLALVVVTIFGAIPNGVAQQQLNDIRKATYRSE